MRFFNLFISTTLVFSLFSQKIEFTAEEQAWIKANPSVYFGYDPNWPPYEFYNDGEYSGIAGDFVKIVSKKTGIKFIPIKNITWDRSYKLLIDNGLSMAPAVAITEDRKKTLIYSEPYVKLPAVIATKIENADLNTLEKLHNKRISIPRGYMQQEYLQKNHPEIKLTLRNNFAECLQDVSSGTCVATVGSLGSITYFIKENGFSNIIVTAHTEIDNIDVAFAFPKDQDTLRNIIDKALKTISPDEKSKIYSRWISINFIDESDYKNFWKYVLLISVIVIFILALVYLWNKSLRKQINLRKEIEDELHHTLEEVNKQNNDKTILLQEIHHRVKNNLQIIISLLRLQTNSHSSPDVQEALNEAIDRVNSISLIHDHLYKNPNLGEINLATYIQNLGEEMKRVFVKDIDVQFDINTNDTQLNIKPIIPLALILNELITNSLKYAFRNKTHGLISINLFLKDDNLHFNYKDDGEWFYNEYSRNFGTYILEIFTEQLDGTFERIEGKSANYKFVFKSYKD